MERNKRRKKREKKREDRGQRRENIKETVTFETVIRRSVTFDWLHVSHAGALENLSSSSNVCSPP